jgi:hypothetical protein
VELALSDDVASLVKSRGINYLLHFTRASNLGSILQLGLVPRSLIEKKVDAYTVNDPVRWDGRQDYNCVSIAFPNAPMLYSFMQANAGVEWPILVLNPSILIEKEVLFCKHNAADKRISSQPADDLKSVSSFRQMFVELDGLPSRADQSLKTCDPTDVQAEPLVRGTIEPKYISAVVFPSAQLSAEFKYKMGTRKSILQDRTGLYANRIYYRKWGQGR